MPVERQLLLTISCWHGHPLLTCMPRCAALQKHQAGGGAGEAGGAQRWSSLLAGKSLSALAPFRYLSQRLRSRASSAAEAADSEGPAQAQEAAAAGGPLSYGSSQLWCLRKSLSAVMSHEGRVLEYVAVP